MKKHVLIVGASGLIGTAAANSFLREGWQVTTSSRRTPELLSEPTQHLSLDLRDARACEVALSNIEPITHVVYAAVSEAPGLLGGWQDPHQIQLNGQMFDNLLNALPQPEHVTVLQGTKAYGAAIQPMRVPARESQARVEHPNFYWLHEDSIRSRDIPFTIFRPQLVVGPNHGVAMNPLPVIGVYGALLKAMGKPLAYPGGPNWVWEAVDTRLVGDACLWAATSAAAVGETFNLTNGEVFMWRDLWPAIAHALGMQTGEDEPRSVVDFIAEHADLWADIVASHKLQKADLATLLGESHHYTDLCFAHGAQQSPPPTFVSTVKVKQAGFTDTYDTQASVVHWLKDLQFRRVIPGP